MSWSHCGAGGGRSVVAEDAELAAVDGRVVEGGPLRGELDGVFDARGVPAVLTVLIEEILSGEGGFLIEFGGDVFGRGGVGNGALGADFGIGPGGSLMGEGEGLVVVKGIDDVVVSKWLEDEEVAEAGPVGAGGDDGVVRGDLADGLRRPEPGCRASARGPAARARS